MSNANGTRHTIQSITVKVLVADLELIHTTWDFLVLTRLLILSSSYLLQVPQMTNDIHIAESKQTADNLKTSKLSL